MEPVFTARGLARTYDMGEVVVRALEGVALDIGRGEFIVLLRPSGIVPAGSDVLQQLGSQQLVGH